MIHDPLKNIIINDTFRKMRKEFDTNTAQVCYVVTNTESRFVGVYSSLEKAQSIVDMLGGRHDGHNLVISYEYIDDPLAR